jgi:hypothetical protein
MRIAIAATEALLQRIVPSFSLPSLIAFLPAPPRAVSSQILVDAAAMLTEPSEITAPTQIRMSIMVPALRKPNLSGVLD